MNYEYKFVEVPVKYSFKTKAGDSFENCKSIIQQEASNGGGEVGANCYTTQRKKGNVWCIRVSDYF